MSQENIKTVRDAFVAYNRAIQRYSTAAPDRGDLDAFLDEYWTDDIDYRAVEGALDDHGPIQGKDALRAFMQDWLDMFDDFAAEPVELIEAEKTTSSLSSESADAPS